MTALVLLPDYSDPRVASRGARVVKAETQRECPPAPSLGRGSIGPCIETTFKRNRHGYGECNYRRFGQRVRFAHRLAWIDAHGMLPPAGTPNVLHRCDNPACVNPEHLYAGTHADNMRDMIARGRNYWLSKTHCPRGHAYTVENTRVRPSGSRQCRACDRERDRKRTPRVRPPKALASAATSSGIPPRGRGEHNHANP